MEKYSYGKGFVYIDPDNYIYSLKNNRGNRFYLYCHEKGCNGSSAIINDKVKHIRPHNHYSDEKEANMIKFKAILKYRCQTELCKNVKEIFHEAKKTNEDMGLTAVEFNKFKANMYRDRRRVAPNISKKTRPTQIKKSKHKKASNKLSKNDLKIQLKEEIMDEEEEEENVTYNQQSVNSDENLTTFTDDINNFSNEEILILSNDNTQVLTENSEYPENCCLNENLQEDCEHKKEIKTLRKKMISILKDHSYTNIDNTKKENDEDMEAYQIEYLEEENEEDDIDQTVDEDQTEYQEATNLEVLSDNELTEFIVEPSPSSNVPVKTEEKRSIPQENLSRKYTQLRSMDLEDQIITNEIKLEILNSEDLRSEVDKLRKEILILKKLLIEKERIIDSQEKYILLLENRR